MNIEVIKRSGLLLGLEAELNAQTRNLSAYVKDRKWVQARQCNDNIHTLLNELIKLDEKPTVKTPSIDDLDERIDAASANPDK
jgi:hypothetical protein